ncbi:hypothetical protein [Paenibacillus crassostreae]|uniref:hypothetical protein n=1 Tax=Paenibacillus crassostreae TaxID=1763538 RepID=UPI0008DBB941|nr:hypothetical protein [Paenibacillus crassostreae]AOZ94857.1 hypothetical protein LPB68_21535 [Paenibacillus crassostreae]
MDFKRTYSLVDVSERIGRPRTTLADWARQFKRVSADSWIRADNALHGGSGRVIRIHIENEDANEHPDSIREQLRGVVREIIVPMTNDDDGKPYLMQLAGEIDQLKRAVVMLAEQNDGLRRELDEARREAATGTEQLSGRISDVQNSLGDEIRKGQEQTSAQLGEILSRVDTYGKQPRGLLRWFSKGN